MNISDYLRTALLNHAFGDGAYTQPTTLYAGLYQVAPTSAGGGTEVSAAGYVRVPTTWTIASLGSLQNLGAIRFPASGVTSSNWGTATTLGLFDAPTTGHMLWFGPLSAAVLMAFGTSFNLAALDLTIGLS